MSYQLTESAKRKYWTVMGILLFSGALPMAIAGLIIAAIGL